MARIEFDRPTYLAHAGVPDLRNPTPHPSNEASAMLRVFDQEEIEFPPEAELWGLRLPEGAKFLDFYRLRPEDRNDICRWAVDCGLLEEATVYHVWYWNVNHNAWDTMLMANEAEARAEAADSALSLTDHPLDTFLGTDGQTLEKRPGYILTDAALERLRHDTGGRCYYLLDIVTLWAAETIARDDEDVIGVYFAGGAGLEDIRPYSHLVFPERVYKAVIFPPKGATVPEELTRQIAEFREAWKGLPNTSGLRP